MSKRKALGTLTLWHCVRIRVGMVRSVLKDAFVIGWRDRCGTPPVSNACSEVNCLCGGRVDPVVKRRRAAIDQW